MVDTVNRGGDRARRSNRPSVKRLATRSLSGRGWRAIHSGSVTSSRAPALVNKKYLPHAGQRTSGLASGGR